ncbi:sensor histidine kinase [Methanoplanus endosymbiosus]|uniref:histidine kinase n=1 Tax=Methanoplanus endosymbiosus TaxID=33865 RepID=A0A9E7PPG7_9EURY|nr:PAS domain-containing sensor histidine kinase [Methanoplanus endosymbiosus]UUX92664.1 PAS domain-containing sensor histidine kinase [Methanoplanus endosymbiosus]
MKIYSNESDIDKYREVMADLFSESRDGVWEWNRVNGKIFLNDVSAEMLGFKSGRDTFNMKDIIQIVNPVDLEGLKAFFNMHFNGEKTYIKHLFRVRGNDSSWKWILIRGKVILRSKIGNPAYLAGIITCMKAPEYLRPSKYSKISKLKEINRMFTGFTPDYYRNISVIVRNVALVTGSFMSGYIKCKGGISEIISEYNPEGKDLLDEILVAFPESYFLSEKCPQKTVLKISLKSGFFLIISPVFMGRNLIGSLFAINSVDFSLTDDEKELIKILCTAVFVEENRFKSEIALKERQDHINLAIKGGNISFWNYDIPERKILFYGEWNDITGWESVSEDNFNIFFSSVFHKDDAEEVRSLYSEFNDLMVSGIDHRCRIFSKSGEVLGVRILGDITDYDKNNGAIKISGVIIDETRLRNYHRSLEAANRKLHLLSGITGHDVTNQLCILKGYLELMGDEKCDNDLISFGLKECLKVAGMINGQVEFSGDYRNIGMEKPAWQDVGNIVLHLSEMPVFSDVSIKTEIRGVEIYADAMLEKVLYNLIDNSIRYGGGKTEINLEFSESSSCGRLVYSDNGPGIADDIKETIFLRGYGSNTGYGLFLIREILDITDIRISECGYEGAGALFVMEIPFGNYRYSGAVDERVCGNMVSDFTLDSEREYFE